MKAQLMVMPWPDRQGCTLSYRIGGGAVSINLDAAQVMGLCDLLSQNVDPPGGQEAGGDPPVVLSPEDEDAVRRLLEGYNG